MSLVNKVHMLLQLKLWYADFSIPSAIQVPESYIYLFSESRNNSSNDF